MVPCLQGDEGVPLTVEIDNEFRQIGIVSGKYGSCDKRVHVYTRLTEYLDWIEENSDVVIDK